MYFLKTFLSFVFICIICISGTEINEFHRSKRQLLFPNSTLLQFNAGVGTPSPAKNINFNFAFQANFQLPWNRTQIPTDILHVYSGYDGTSRKKREGEYENDAKLFHFYKYIEEVLDSFGHNGTACVKQALCQIGSQPLQPTDDDDLLHELASFVLNPSNDVEPDAETATNEASPYILAHKHGREVLDCAQLYRGCKLSLVDMFTQLHQGS